MVEDSEDLLLITRQTLESKGYFVLVARNGDEALHLSGKYPGPIHLILSDVVLPGMSGMKVWQALQETRPEIGVLFVSGYETDEISKIPPAKRNFAFLPKPFSGSALIQKIREILEGKQ
ncbi:MAG: response regulator [Candidatus Ozemobacteraceae bacterium]